MLQFSSELQREGGRRTTAARAAPSLQRKCACGGTPGPTGECEECRKKRLAGMQRHLATDAQTATLDSRPLAAPPVVHEVLRAPGEPLHRASQAALESRFKFDFSHVRVHTDARAADSARAVDALAYTVGRDVVFGAGQYRPGTAAGESLLAHELAHVVQQHGTTFEPGQTVPLAPSGDHFEREAEAAGTHAQFSAPAGTAGLGLQRTEDKPPGPKTLAEDCSGWFQDHESLSKRAAEVYVRTELSGTHGTVKKIECDIFAPNGAFGCTVWFSDGTPIRVIARPDSIVVGKFPLQSMTPPPDQPLCFYSFKCPGPNFDLVLTKIRCQVSPPAKGTSPGGSPVGPQP